MNSITNRRRFLKATAAGLALNGLATGAWGAPGEKVVCSTPLAEQAGWLLSMQLYTFRAFPFDQAIEMIAKLGICHVEPAFFLRLSTDDPTLKTGESLDAEQRKAFKAMLDGFGIRMSTFYCKLGTDEAACRKAFDFAREMGAINLVSEPPAEAFELIDRLCNEYEINLAVHNHPKRPNSKYWSPESVLEVCKDRSERIGGCCDTGHWVRSGLDPVECLEKMEGRIVSMHLKDVAEWGVVGARDVPLGKGKAKYPAVLDELRRQEFVGQMSIEYEHQSPQLCEEVAESLAFVEKTVAGRS